MDKREGNSQHTRYDFHTFPFAPCSSRTVKRTNTDRVESIVKSNIVLQYVYVNIVSIYCYDVRQYSYFPLKFLQYRKSTETFLSPNFFLCFYPVALPSTSTQALLLSFLFHDSVMALKLVDVTFGGCALASVLIGWCGRENSTKAPVSHVYSSDIVSTWRHCHTAAAHVSQI